MEVSYSASKGEREKEFYELFGRGSSTIWGPVPRTLQKEEILRQGVSTGRRKPSCTCPSARVHCEKKRKRCVSFRKRKARTRRETNEPKSRLSASIIHNRYDSLQLSLKGRMKRRCVSAERVDGARKIETRGWEEKRTNGDGDEPRADLLDPLLLLQIIGLLQLTIRRREPRLLVEESLDLQS